jgi:hypothetical protein
MKASVTVPTTYKIGDSSTKARISLELLYKRLASRSQRSLLAAANHDVWQDATIRMENNPDLIGVQVSTIRAADRIKFPSTPSDHAGQLVGADVFHFPPESGITPDTKYAAGLICVDNYSSFSLIYGLPWLTTEQVVHSLKQFAADNGHVNEFGLLTFEKLKSDSGSQFTSKEVRVYCCDNGVCLSLAAPKQQWQNHCAEWTWQTIHNMARSMLVHARLPDDYWYHAVRYALAVFNLLPVQGLKNAAGNCGTPYELFTGRKLLISHFRVFGCPVVAKKWTVQIDGKRKDNNAQCGIRGVFIGFPANQKGYLLYIPSSWQIVVSGDVAFDETFYSAIVTTWKPFHDSLVLHPTASFIPDPNTTVEVTGDINSMFPPTEEGIYGQHRFLSEHQPTYIPQFEEGPAVEEEEEFNLIDLNDDQSSVNEEYELVPTSNDIEESPQVVDNSASLRTSGRTRKPPQRLTFDHQAAARDWSEQANFCSDVDLLRACAADANDADLADIDISKFFPPPSNLREIQRIKDPVLRKHWMKAHYKEVKVLIDSHTFILGDTPGPNEPVTPTMETNRVKLGSDGKLDKLKVRVVVRGDLQNKTLTEDKWSPTAFFRTMKMFLADASRHKARVRQLDFIGAFLQAKVHSRVFICMPASYCEIWPEFKPYCGVPVHLAKSM